MGRVEHSAFRFIVHGRVQGVGFRYSTLHRAQMLKLTGYVQNTADGSVLVWAEGAISDLDSLYRWLQKGPSFAHVERVDRYEFTPTGKYKNFFVSG